jgi:hypothetical protein
MRYEVRFASLPSTSTTVFDDVPQPVSAPWLGPNVMTKPAISTPKMR